MHIHGCSCRINTESTRIYILFPVVPFRHFRVQSVEKQDWSSQTPAPLLGVRPSRGALCARPSASVQLGPSSSGTVLPVCRSLAFASMTNDRTSCSIRPGFLRATIKSRSWIIKLWQFYSLSIPQKKMRESERWGDHYKGVITLCQFVKYRPQT